MSFVKLFLFLIGNILSLWLLFPVKSSAWEDPFGVKSMTAASPLGSSGQTISIDPCAIQKDLKGVSLQDVVNIALCRNPQTHEAWANARAQAANVGVARSDYLPDLDASIERNRFYNSGSSTSTNYPYNQTSLGLSLNYLIYDFGGRAANLENARQLLIAANASQDRVIQQLFLTAVQAYYQVFATQASLDAAMQTEKSSLESFNAATARYDVGVATLADKLQAQTAYSQAVLNRITAQGNFKNAQGMLANIMGFDANKPIELLAVNQAPAIELFERDVAQLIEEARQHRPDLLAAQAQYRAAQASVDSARAAGKPSLSLGVNANRVDSGNTFNSSSIGLTLSIPIFSGFLATYRIQNAQALAEVRAAQRDQTNLQVALNVWQSYQNLLTATQAVRSAQDLLDSAIESEKVALGRYKAGVGNILDVLNAQSALASARQQQVQASYNWNVARVTLAQAMGVVALEMR